MRIAGAVVVDLRTDDEQPINAYDDPRRTYLWHCLAVLPDGADVVLLVDPRARPYGDLIEIIHDQAANAGTITVWCSDHETIAHWCTVLRGQDYRPADAWKTERDTFSTFGGLDGQRVTA